MVQYPPNYKEQETYYASQEYKDGVEQALETGNKLPTLETRDRKITSRNRNKKLPPLSYPLATGSNQRTGDRLVIKCLKFVRKTLNNGQLLRDLLLENLVVVIKSYLFIRYKKFLIYFGL